MTIGIYIKTKLVLSDNKPCTQHTISAMRGLRGLDFEDCRHDRDSEWNRS